MKTTWRLYILWSVYSLSIAIFSTTADIYESSSILRPVRKKLSHAGNRKSDLRLTSHITSPSPQLIPDLALRAAPAGPFSSTRPEKLRLVRQERPEPNIQSDFAYLPDVSVTCSTSDLVVRVKTNFYGLGASAAELTLGSTCKSNGILRPYGDLLFTYPLTKCDAQREMPRDHLVYNYVLHYVTSPKIYPTRRNRIDVDIQCRFQRHHHVYQLAVRPTWQTYVVRKKLKGRLNAFQIQLMDDLWTMPAKSQAYQLGQTVNFQVSTSNLPPGGKLYISSCYATLSNGSKSSPTYTIIDNYGCMLESQRSPRASRFISPRTDKTLRFSLGAFQFITDPDAEVFIHCKLFVTSDDPSPARKSCTYRANRWRALTGDDSICDCCASQCVTSKSRRAMVEGSASSGPLLVSDQPSTPEDSFLPVIPSLVNMREEEDDDDVLRFETEMHQQISEFHSPEAQLDYFDVAKYDGDADQQSPTDLMMEEDEEMEEDNGVTLEEKEKLSFSPGLIMEERQQSSVRDSELIGEDGSGSVDMGQFLEREEGKLGSESELERKRSELREVEVKDDGISNERQGVHLQREEEVEPPLAGVEEMLLSEKEGISKPIEKRGEDTEQTLETRGMEEEKGEKSTGRGEEVEEAIVSEDEWQIDDGIPSYDLVEMSMVDGREMTWHFKWR